MTRAVELGVVLGDDAFVAALNLRYRGRAGPTNVLAFAAGEAAPLAGPADAPLLMGDVVLAFETIEAEARAGTIPLGDHLSHLVVHGVLHLAGHDHLQAGAAETMQALETKALARLGIADPYGAPSTGFPTPE